MSAKAASGGTEQNRNSADFAAGSESVLRVFLKRQLPAALFFASLASIAGAAPLLTIQDLGTLNGSRMTGAAINQSGQVAGYGADAWGITQAFTSFSGVLTPAGAISAAAYGINGNGQVAGTVNFNGNSQAALWVNGAVQLLGGLGGADSYALAINGQGQAVGMAATPDGAGQGFIYSGSNPQVIAPSGSQWSSLYGINDGGAVVGYALDAGMTFRAYTWAPDTGYSTLGTLGGANSYAFAINNAGQIAGHSNVSTGFTHAFLYSGSAMTDLGTLGGSSSYAYGINGSGSVVGYSAMSDGTNHAFLYYNGAMFDLNSLVAGLAGWALTEAYGINDAGQITGAGLLNGVEHAFRLDPLTLTSTASGTAVPEPRSIVLLLAGLGILGFRRYFAS